MYCTAQNDPKMDQLHLDKFDFGRRVAVEKELRTTDSYNKQELVFDESGAFLLVPSIVGIKIINLMTNQLARVLGRPETGERPLSLALLQTKGEKVS